MTKKVLLILLVQFIVISNCGISLANEYDNLSTEGVFEDHKTDSIEIESNPEDVSKSSLNASPQSESNFKEYDYNKTYNTTDSKWNEMRAYWMWTADLDNFDPVKLKNSGITDLFFVVKGTSGKLYYSELEKAIEKCKPQGIRVHAWIICFKDESKGSWVDQTDQSYQSYLRGIVSHIINNYDVDGIHLDYVRYSGDESKNHAAWQQPGGTPEAVNTITNFVQSVYNIVKSKNPHLAVSAALMPQMEDNARLYAQDYDKLADYLDFLVPMIYRGTFKQDNAWIGTTTKWIVEHSKGKPVIAGIMTYYSDEDQTMLPPLELLSDVKIALQNGASGFALFRYGLTSEVPQINIVIPMESTIDENITPNLEMAHFQITKKVPMQKTGFPILLILLAFLIVLGGLYSKRN